VRILFALPGLHRVHRGAEVAFESVAQEIALRGEHEVLLAGSGPDAAGRAYRFRRVGAIRRERFEGWPSVPFLRDEYMYEELTFAAGLATAGLRRGVDVTVTCGYPYTNWALRARLPGGRRPPHVFVTQNGDWPARVPRREYRFFGCEGLICTNPEYYARNRERWHCALVPNGFDPTRFRPGPRDRAALGLPADAPMVLMASALIDSKRVREGIRAVARIPEAFLLVAGDGPLRDEVDRLAAELLPGRFARRTFPFERMADVYRSADALLHLALAESFGNVYVEALGCGLPVVAHDGPVSRWILEQHGFLVDTTDEEALVASLRRALASGAAGGERAAFAASRYTWDAVATKYVEFLADVVRRSDPGGRSRGRHGAGG
jgi:glycosyltransferase involved in cell wall biosynthesis